MRELVNNGLQVLSPVDKTVVACKVLVRMSSNGRSTTCCYHLSILVSPKQRCRAHVTRNKTKMRPFGQKKDGRTNLTLAKVVAEMVVAVTD
jgi:hypothetical protein